MAFKTDMTKAKAKSEEEKERAAKNLAFGRRVTWWKAKPGTNKIRILPPWTDQGPNKNQFWREVWMHYGVTNMEAPDEDNTFAVPCPKRSPDGKHVVGDGEVPECKICNLVDELKATGNPADAELAKQLRSKMRLYVNMIDLNDPFWTEDDITTLKANGCPEDNLPEMGNPKVQVYNFGPNIFKEILDNYSDDTDLADLDEGHDIVIEREGVDLKTKYRVRAKMKATVAPIKDEQLDNSMWNMDTLVPYFTEEQVDLILEGGSKEDVYGLTSGAQPESKQLTEKKEEPEEEPEAEEAEPEEEVQGSTSLEDDKDIPTGPEDPSILVVDTVPVDADGDIDYSKLTNEQISNPENESVIIENAEGDEASPYIPCFGKEDERNPEDETCRECFLLERCGKFIETKKEAEAAALKAAEEAKKKKKGPGKKKRGRPPGKTAPGKKTAGKSKGNGAKKTKAKAEEKKPAADADDLEAQMRKAMENQ
jgi:hypothetical protein